MSDEGLGRQNGKVKRNQRIMGQRKWRMKRRKSNGKEEKAGEGGGGGQKGGIPSSHTSQRVKAPFRVLGPAWWSFSLGF